MRSPFSSSKALAEFASIFVRTRSAYLEHENAKAELKGLVPEDAQQAIGHGLRAKRSKTARLSISQPYWRIRRGNGSLRIGRFVRLMKWRARSGWARRLPMLGDMRSSH
jgi:hypothetical protein